MEEILTADEVDNIETSFKGWKGDDGQYVLMLCKSHRALVTENKRLREALEKIASEEFFMCNGASWHDVSKMRKGLQAIASAALKGGASD